MSWQVIQERFQRNFIEGKLPQGLLFYGPSSINKKNDILDLVKSLLHKQHLTQDIFTALDAEIQQNGIKKNKKLIGVDEIRSLTTFSCTTTDYKNKFILINGCDFLSLSASNALLKLLEIQDVKTKYILTAAKPSKLPKTLLSRVVQVRLEEDSLKAILQDYHQEQHQMITYLYKAFSGNKYKIQQFIRENYVSMLEIIQNNDPLNLLPYLVDKIDSLEILLPIILYQLTVFVQTSTYYKSKKIITIIDCLKARALEVKKYNLDPKKAFTSLLYNLINANIDSSDG
jgi:DNA polymerase III delta prime subunit